MVSPPTRPDSALAPAVFQATGPVTGHRIAQIRRRIALGRYPVDSAALASEIAGHDGQGSAHGGSIGNAVVRMLSIAIDRLDHDAALVLQLEFVEQLAGREIAATVGTSADEVAKLRSAALLKLRSLLDDDASTAGRAVSR